MSRFSEHLEQCIIDSGMTENLLAKASGFNRSYIALMKNGQRVSPDTGKMVKLLEALNLSPYEYDALWLEYIQAKMGDVVYERHLAVLSLMESFGDISHMDIRSFYKHDIPAIKTVFNRMDLEYLVKAVLEQEAVKENGCIRLVMQPDLSVLGNILPGLCKNNEKLQLEHIICLENNGGNGSEQGQIYNIRMLQELMPTVISGTGDNYRIYYYYDHVASHFNAASLMPYMILTSDYLLIMNSSMDKGILSSDPEVAAVYETLFRNHKRGCRLLLKRIEDESEMLEYQMGRKTSEDTTYTIAQQPCFGVLKVDGLVKKYFALQNDRAKILLEQLLRQNHKSMEEQGKKMISYCTKSGLKRFAEKGIIDELPGEMYRPLEREDRKMILQLLKEAIEEGKYQLYLFDEQSIDFPKELFITSKGVLDTGLVFLSEKETGRFIIHESGLTKVFYEFFRDFVKSPQVSDTGHTLAYLEKLMDVSQRTD